MTLALFGKLGTICLGVCTDILIRCIKKKSLLILKAACRQELQKAVANMGYLNHVEISREPCDFTGCKLQEGHPLHSGLLDLIG